MLDLTARGYANFKKNFSKAQPEEKPVFNKGGLAGRMPMRQQQAEQKPQTLSDIQNVDAQTMFNLFYNYNQDKA